MTPRQAFLIDSETEPDWRELFDARIDDLQKLKPDRPRYLVEDEAFEQLLKEWRRFHCIGSKVGERVPAPAVEAMIALAKLHIFPPSSPRDGVRFEEQHDDHCWLIIDQRAWRIVDAEDRTLMLDSFGEQMQIDLNKAKWEKYNEAAQRWLEAAWK
jgi:hypothetical protein